MKSKFIVRVLTALWSIAAILILISCQKEEIPITYEKSSSKIELTEKIPSTAIAEMSNSELVESDSTKEFANVTSDSEKESENGDYYSLTTIELPKSIEKKELRVIDFCLKDDNIVFLTVLFTNSAENESKTLQEIAASFEYGLLFYDFDGNLENEIILDLDRYIDKSEGYTRIQSIFENTSGEVSLFVNQIFADPFSQNCQIFTVDDQGEIQENIVKLIDLNSQSKDLSQIMFLVGVESNLYAIAERGIDIENYRNIPSHDVIVYDTVGTEIFRINSSELDGENVAFDESVNILTDGTSVYVREIFSGGIYKVDLESQELVFLLDTPYSTIMSSNGSLGVTDDNGFSFLDINTGETKQVFLWKDIDFEGSYNRSQIVKLSEDSFLLQEENFANVYILKKD